MTDTQHTPASPLDLAGGSEEERLAAHVADVRHRIEEAAYQYYSENNPVLSDAEYDQLIMELQRIEEDHPELQSPDSPTQRVGGGGAAPCRTCHSIGILCPC